MILKGILGFILFEYAEKNKEKEMVKNGLVLEKTLQKTGGLGRVFLGRVSKNAAQKCLMPRFLQTGLKAWRSSRVFKTGP